MAIDDKKLTELASNYDPFPILNELQGNGLKAPAQAAPSGFASMMAPQAPVAAPVPPAGIPPAVMQALQQKMMQASSGHISPGSASPQMPRQITLPGITGAAPVADPRIRVTR